MKRILIKKMNILVVLAIAAAIMFPFSARAAITTVPAQVNVTFMNKTLLKPVAYTTELSIKLSVVDDSFTIVPNTAATWNAGVATIQFQDAAASQIQPWKGSYYLVVEGTHYTELIPFKISSPTANVNLTVSYIPDYATIAAFTNDTNVTATNISVVSGLAPKKTPVMLQDSKGDIFLQTSDANTGIYNFFVPTGAYGIGLVGRNDSNQGADTNIFGSGTTTPSSINFAGSGNTEAWYKIKTVAGQVTGPMVNTLSPSTSVAATMTPDSTVMKNASAPKIFGKVTGASNISVIGFNYVVGTGAADPVVVSGKITVPKTGDQTFSLTLPRPFDGSKMELVYANTPNNATFDTTDFDFSALNISMKVTAPTAATTYDKDIKLTIASTSTDTTVKAFETKALANVPTYLLYSTTTTFPDVPAGTVVTDVSSTTGGAIAISTDSKVTTGVAFYSSGSVTIKGGTLPKVATAGYYFKIVAGKCWSGDTTSASAYTVNAPGSVALSAVAAAGSATGTTKVTVTGVASGDTLKYLVSNAVIPAATSLTDVSSWTSYTSGADISGVDAINNKYLAVVEVNSSGNPVKFKSFTLSASNIKAGTTTTTTTTTGGQKSATPTSGYAYIYNDGTLTSGTVHIMYTTPSSDPMDKIATWAAYTDQACTNKVANISASFAGDGDPYNDTANNVVYHNGTLTLNVTGTIAAGFYYITCTDGITGHTQSDPLKLAIGGKSSQPGIFGLSNSAVTTGYNDATHADLVTANPIVGGKWSVVNDGYVSISYDQTTQILNITGLESHPFNSGYTLEIAWADDSGNVPCDPITVKIVNQQKANQVKFGTTTAGYVLTAVGSSGNIYQNIATFNLDSTYQLNPLQGYWYAYKDAALTDQIAIPNYTMALQYSAADNTFSLADGPDKDISGTYYITYKDLPGQYQCDPIKVTVTATP